MSSDKKRNSAEAIREMEDIMAGLENFLEQELAKMENLTQKMIWFI